VLVVWAVAAHHKLHSVTNLLMASLAVADITVALLVMPYLLVYDLTRTWNFGWLFCHLWISCDVMCCTASILHLCLIALDRYVAISRPLHYKMLMPKRRAVVLIVFAWLCSAAISFFPVMLGWYAESRETYHDSSQCGLRVNKTYAIVSSLTSFYIPSQVMLYIYIRIFFIAKKQSHEIQRLEHLLPQNTNRLEHRRIMRYTRKVLADTKATRTLGLIIGTFILCWMPFFLMYIILPFCQSCSLQYEAQSAITWLGYVNSSMNPCIYGFFNTDFRQAFKKAMHCDCGRRADALGRNTGSNLSIDDHSLHSIDSVEMNHIDANKPKLLDF